jgi:hypothetical protein
MQDEIVFSEKGWRALWRAVLDQAFKDAEGRVGTYAHRKDAREWFRSTGKDIGTFLWICEVLDVDPEVTLARLDQDGNMIPNSVRPLFGYQEHAFAAAS